MYSPASSPAFGLSQKMQPSSSGVRADRMYSIRHGDHRRSTEGPTLDGRTGFAAAGPDQLIEVDPLEGAVPDLLLRRFQEWLEGNTPDFRPAPLANCDGPLLDLPIPHDQRVGDL